MVSWGIKGRSTESESRYRRVSLCVLSFLVYLTWLAVSVSGQVVEGFEATYALPAVFIAVFFTLLWKPLFGGRGPFVITYAVMEMMRFVVLSAVTVAAVADQGQLVFGKNTYSSGQLNAAALLMIYELVVTAVAVYFLSDKERSSERRPIACNFSTPVYIAVIVVALGAVVAIPSARSGLTVLMSYDDEGTTNLSTTALLVRELFVTAKYLLFFVAIKWVCKKGEDGKVAQNSTSLVILCLVSLLVIGIRIGTNRKRIVADAIACAAIILVEFPRYRRQLVAFFAAVAFVLVGSTSVFRGATESISSLTGDLFEAGSLQSYLCGQYNVASSLETRKVFGSLIGLDTLAYSTFRSCFGIGSLISGMGTPTLHDYFNTVASANYTYVRESQIIPSIGEGVIYFGNIASPLISLVIVVLGIQIDKFYKKSNRVEARFVLIVLAVYVGQGLSLSSNIIMNNVSFKLALFVPIVLIANYFGDSYMGRKHAQ